MIYSIDFFAPGLFTSVFYNWLWQKYHNVASVTCNRHVCWHVDNCVVQRIAQRTNYYLARDSIE